MENENQPIASQTELLIRIDERTKNFGKDITDIKVDMVKRKEFEDFQLSVRDAIGKAVTKDEFIPVKESLVRFATKDEIKPIRAIAFGAIGTVATAVLLTLVAMAMQGATT